MRRLPQHRPRQRRSLQPGSVARRYGRHARARREAVGRRARETRRVARAHQRDEPESMRIAVAAFALAAHLAGASSDEITLTAASVNVVEPGTPVKVTILRWSSEDELRPIVTALAAPPAQPSDAARANAAAAGRGRA